MSVLQEIIRYDKEFFKVLNGQWTNSFFDAVFPYLRNGNFWMPLYLFLFVFILTNFKRNGWWWFLLGLVTVASSDFLNSFVIREWLQNWIFRDRPCSDITMYGHVRFIANYCPQSSSFMSSHAANHFAMAMFIFSTLKNYIGKWVGLFFVWAFFIAYAQVYVGVHYPLDVICGGLFGLAIGYGWARFFKRNFSLEEHH
jgi:undecaprenyl-diphosphatase